MARKLKLLAVFGLGVIGMAAASCSSCDGTNLNVDYSSDAIPDATSEAWSSMELDTNTWEVVFTVHNVKTINNGHVIANAVDGQTTAELAFTPYVSTYNAGDLWTQPTDCASIAPMDQPATNLNIQTAYTASNCTKSYEMRYSLTDVNARDETHCDLTDVDDTITVNCSIVLSSVRAFASNEQFAFTAQEAAFTGRIDLGNKLNNEVADLMHATMAKCSVKNGPLYVVDCRVPGDWDFDQNSFSVVQEPAGWINGGSCASTKTSVATFIRCDIENDAPIATVQTARANITGTPIGNPSNALTFDVEFIVPRRLETTTSASLASFIQNLAMADGKYYYGTADKATLHIDVVDSALLTMTALELFNDENTVKDLQAEPRFQTAVNTQPDGRRFIIDFYPAAVREDSRFYRYGPHGINVSFTFQAASLSNPGTPQGPTPPPGPAPTTTTTTTAAPATTTTTTTTAAPAEEEFRRRQGQQIDESGFAAISGINIEGTEDDASSSNGSSAAGSTSSVALVAAAAVGACVLIVGAVAAVVVGKKRRQSTAQVAVEPEVANKAAAL